MNPTDPTQPVASNPDPKAEAESILADLKKINDSFETETSALLKSIEQDISDTEIAVDETHATLSQETSAAVTELTDALEELQ